MGLFDKFNKFFGIIGVRVLGNQVRVTGLDGLIMGRYISKIWETNLVVKHMFTEMTPTSFKINSFFIPDLVYMLSKVHTDPTTPWSAKRTIDKIMKELLKETWYGKTIGPVPSIIDESRLKLLKWQPMQKQLDFLHLYGDKLPRYGLKGYILAFGPGLGKFQPVDSPVKTPGGWTRMGDIKPGDLVVTPDGGTAPVSQIHPQGMQDIYRIRFEDGRWTDCGLPHLWKVYTKKWNETPGRGWRVVQTSDIIEMLKMPTYRDRTYIQLTEPEITDDVELPIDPYVLGVILGDGTVTNSSVSVCKPDQFIKDELDRILAPHYKTSDWHSDEKVYTINALGNTPHMRHTLEDLGLWGTIHDTKFIPEIYMRASARQKTELLQGLMDTDGHTMSPGIGRYGKIGSCGSIEFSTTSQKMGWQVQYLIRSLGGLCKLKVKKPFFTYKGERKQGKDAYIIRPRMKDPSSLFRLPRKKERVSGDYQYSDYLKLRIKSIEYVGRKEAQCITVDHPDHLYITDDYIVTHNTFTDIMVATCVIPPSVAEVKIIISPKKALHLVWEKTVKTVFKKTPTVWTCDSGSQMPHTGCEYYIFNFEQIDRADMLAQSLHNQGVKYFIIVDESHNFADHKSNRTQKLAELQNKHDYSYFIWTSGTPIIKHAAEMVTFLKCSDPRFDTDAEGRFKRIFASNKGKAGEIFNHRLGQQMAMAVAKTDDDIPAPIVKELPVRLPKQLSDKFLMTSVRAEMKDFIAERLKFYAPKMGEFRKLVNHCLEIHLHTLKTRPQRKRFDEYVKNVKMMSRNPDLRMEEQSSMTKTYERRDLLPSLPPHLRKEYRSAISAIKNIKLKVRGEALGTILAKRRAECAMYLAIYCRPEDIIKESLSKTLFFASSVMPVKALNEYLKKKGFDPRMVYAGTNSQLSKIMDEFDNDPNVNPLIATFPSLSEAVPVTSASVACFLNRPFRENMHQQALARVWRLSQVHQVTLIEVTLDTDGEPNVSSTTDDILAAIREDIAILIGPLFAGPDPSEREYAEAIDASQESIEVMNFDRSIGIY